MGRQSSQYGHCTIPDFFHHAAKAHKACMIRWMFLIFILLVLVNSATGWVQKVGLGRLPGDFTFRMLGREVFVPCASAVLVTVALMSTIKLVAWLM